MKRSSTPCPVFPRHTAGIACLNPRVTTGQVTFRFEIVAIVAAAYSSTVPPAGTAAGGTAAPAGPGPAFLVVERPVEAAWNTDGAPAWPGTDMASA